MPGAPLPGLPQLTFAEPDDVRELADASTITLAGLPVAIRHTPGHTAGSVMFELSDDDEQALVFAGDVLFAGSIGRVDLPGGSMDEMLHSLKAVILPMADDTVIYPGHGADDHDRAGTLDQPVSSGAGMSERASQVRGPHEIAQRSRGLVLWGACALARRG